MRAAATHFTHGEGVYVYDREGKQHIDWTSQARDTPALAHATVPSADPHARARGGTAARQTRRRCRRRRHCRRPQAVCVNMGYTIPPAVKQAVNKQLDDLPFVCATHARAAAAAADGHHTHAHSRTQLRWLQHDRRARATLEADGGDLP